MKLLQEPIESRVMRECELAFWLRPTMDKEEKKNLNILWNTMRCRLWNMDLRCKLSFLPKGSWSVEK